MPILTLEVWMYKQSMREAARRENPSWLSTTSIRAGSAPLPDLLCTGPRDAEVQVVTGPQFSTPESITWRQLGLTSFCSTDTPLVSYIFLSLRIFLQFIYCHWLNGDRELASAELHSKDLVRDGSAFSNWGSFICLSLCPFHPDRLINLKTLTHCPILQKGKPYIVMVNCADFFFRGVWENNSKIHALHLLTSVYYLLQNPL